MSFESLGLRAELIRAVSEKGYNTPTPIQQQAIPLILEGRDIMGGAQTGTGKTAGFTLPMLERLMSTAKEYKGRRPLRALILTPTRELAAQVAESVDTYGRHLPLKSTVVFGGVSINPQKQKLIKGVDILIATPGRLLDHVGQRSVNLSQIDILVLDEADRMLDMGFIHDIKKVLALVPKQKQTLLFSATFSDEIKKLSNELLKSPALVEVARRNTASETVNQVVHPVDKARKRELLSFLIGSNNWKQVLVFNRTKHGANRLSEQLGKDGITAAAIHGNKSQGARTKALADFKAGKVRVLVATDIAARGIDIDQLPHVVNYELPNVAEDYVHRIGRTGRAGNEGEAMSLVCVDEHKLLKDIERLIKRDIPKTIISDFEPDPSIKAEPINQGRGRQQGARKPAGKRPPSGRNNPRSNFKSGSNNQSQSRRSTGQAQQRGR
ncbi:MAG: DEAD/DEAH box helicase [Gammaproteobacteria bacterium]|nr:DEAD/DEAH box helicase [Gammaproteobacteria bacterium]MCW8909409.1 DEAD/DEAH box helicase [Gammaproteobacteria bacterium]MCW9004235.1 DEAD/DEAH box helicase [Gammaproteobacteria bacterium]